MWTRRRFLKSGGLSALGLVCAPGFTFRVASAGDSKKGRILLVIFQRGAADGLNIVVPFKEKAYYELRPSIALPPPASGDEQSLIDLDGFFGFHPALRPLMDAFREGHLAVIHAAGSPDNTRSHFDAQDYMESATPGVKSTRDGWLNRYLLAMARPGATPFRGLSMTGSLPRSLQGRASAVAMGSIGGFDVRAGAYSDQVRESFRTLYTSSASPMLRRAGREAFEAVEYLKKHAATGHQPAPGADYPRSPLGNSLRQIAQLIKSDIGLEVAFAETGGWDHHANEGAAQGQLALRLTDYARSLSALYRDLGDRLSEVVVLTMTEFGRTARENGNRGTDHGHAGVMFALGGPVRGGKVYGKWPGLDRDRLYEGRDLALTTDFRNVFGEVLVKHMGLKDPKPVFPGFPVRKENFRGFVSA